MTDGSEDFDWERLKRLRDAMTAEHLEDLNVRFKRDPRSLSADETGVLYLVTREKIRGFEAKARRKREKEEGSNGSEPTV